MNNKHTQHDTIPGESPDPLMFNGYDWECSSDPHNPVVESYHEHYHEENKKEISIITAGWVVFGVALAFGMVMIVFFTVISIFS